MKVKIDAFRFGSSLLRCHSHEGTKTNNDHSSSLFFSSWIDFQLSAAYHNRSLVIWEPLIELWTGNMVGFFNITEILGMEPILTEGSPITKDPSTATKFSWFIDGVNRLRRSRDEKDLSDKHAPSIRLSSGLDLCHLVQCSVIPTNLEQVLHPTVATLKDALHLKENFILRPTTSSDHVPAVLTFSSGKADYLYAKSKSVPLNINVTGALLENISAVLSERSKNQNHISPHYICNNTSSKISCVCDNETSIQEIDPGGDAELNAGFPHRSDIHIELYNDFKSPHFEVIGKVNVDLVGTKRYNLKYLGKQTRNYVIVRYVNSMPL